MYVCVLVCAWGGHGRGRGRGRGHGRGRGCRWVGGGGGVSLGGCATVLDTVLVDIFFMERKCGVEVEMWVLVGEGVNEGLRRVCGHGRVCMCVCVCACV